QMPKSGWQRRRLRWCHFHSQGRELDRWTCCQFVVDVEGGIRTRRGTRWRWPWWTSALTKLRKARAVAGLNDSRPCDAAVEGGKPGEVEGLSCSKATRLAIVETIRLSCNSR